MLAGVTWERFDRTSSMTPCIHRHAPNFNSNFCHRRNGLQAPQSHCRSEPAARITAVSLSWARRSRSRARSSWWRKHCTASQYKPIHSRSPPDRSCARGACASILRPTPPTGPRSPRWFGRCAETYGSAMSGWNRTAPERARPSPEGGSAGPHAPLRERRPGWFPRSAGS